MQEPAYVNCPQVQQWINSVGLIRGKDITDNVYQDPYGMIKILFPY